MADWFIFVLCSLCSWTLASFLVGERGPYAVFERLRKTFGVTKAENASAEDLNRWLNQNPDKTAEEIPDCFAFNEVGLALCCIWCTSMWTAIAVALFAASAGWIEWIYFPVYCFAVRSFALFWNMAIERLDEK